MERLRQRGVGIEAGLASVADAERLMALNGARRSLRILIEVGEQDASEAMAVASGIREVLDRAGTRRPMLLHGFDATVWHFVARTDEPAFWYA